MLLDELVLEKQRLLDVARNQHVDRSRTFDQGRNPNPSVTPARVLAHTILQILRLAHIEHAASSALEEVDTGIRRQSVDLFLEGHAVRHGQVSRIRSASSAFTWSRSSAALSNSSSRAASRISARSPSIRAGISCRGRLGATFSSERGTVT